MEEVQGKFPPPPEGKKFTTLVVLMICGSRVGLIRVSRATKNSPIHPRLAILHIYYGTPLWFKINDNTQVISTVKRYYG